MITEKPERDRIIEVSDLAYFEAKKLRAKNPKHELLRLTDNPEDDAIWNEFQNRFGRKDIECAQEYFWGQYYLALKDSVGVGDDVCFTKEAIENSKNSDGALISKINPADVFTIIAVDSEGQAYLKGAVVYDNRDPDGILISVDQNCLRRA